MNTEDKPICCGKTMGCLYSYIKNGALVRVYQCNSCFRIEEEEGLMIDSFTEEEQ